jgi:2-keto-4-pentenoate hydratase
MSSPAPVVPLEAIVQALAQARRSGQPTNIAEQHPALTLDEAYAVQSGVAKQFAWFQRRPLAWKVGGTPLITAAALPTTLQSPAFATLGGRPEVLVEAELAFRLARTPDNPEDILACLGTVCVSMEWIDTRLAQGLQASAAWKLADQGVHGGLVIGPEVPCEAWARFTLDDWRQQQCRLSVNGQCRSSDGCAHPTVSPLLALPWLVSHAAKHTGPLLAGDLITTGAWTMTTAQAGDLIEASFDGVGSCSLSLG